MAEYIDRGALRESLEQHFQTLKQKYGEERKWTEGYNDGLERAIFDVIFAHAADVAQVRHGRWIELTTWNGCTPDLDLTCSECEASGLPQYKYCPNCGAKMDGSTDFFQK